MFFYARTNFGPLSRETVARHEGFGVAFEIWVNGKRFSSSLADAPIRTMVSNFLQRPIRQDFIRALAANLHLNPNFVQYWLDYSKDLEKSNFPDGEKFEPLQQEM